MASVGTAGVGKLRAAHEFAETLRQSNRQGLEADGNPLEQTAPFSLSKKTGEGGVGDEQPRSPCLRLGLAEASHSDLRPAGLCAVLDRLGDPSDA